MTPLAKLNDQDLAIFGSLHDDLLGSYIELEVWWLLEGEHDKRPISIIIHEKFPEVREILRASLFASGTIRLAKAFGRGNDEISIKKLPGIEGDPKFEEIWKQGRQLHEYRSLYVAHSLFRKQTQNKKSQENPLTNNALRELSKSSCALIDRFAAKHDLPGRTEKTISAIDPIGKFSDFLRKVSLLEP